MENETGDKNGGNRILNHHFAQNGNAPLALQETPQPQAGTENVSVSFA
jgi:hypothetical protein